MLRLERDACSMAKTLRQATNELSLPLPPSPCLMASSTQSLDLVVTTIVLVMLIKHFMIKWGRVENQRQGKAVGFSCVIFAYMTYWAVAMGQFCPLGPSFSTLCFNTWHIPMPGGELGWNRMAWKDGMGWDGMGWGRR